MTAKHRVLFMACMLVTCSGLAQIQAALGCAGQGLAVDTIRINTPTFTFETLFLLTKDQAKTSPILNAWWNKHLEFFVDHLQVNITNNGQDSLLKLTTNGTFDLNRWYHYAFTFDGNYGRLYINGCLMDSAYLPGNVTYTGLFTIGQANYTPYESFWGLMDEWRIWNTCRTAEELKTSMATELDVYTVPGLLTYFKYNQSTENEVAKIDPNAPFSYSWGTTNYFANNTLPSIKVFEVDQVKHHQPTCSDSLSGSIESWVNYPSFSSSIGQLFFPGRTNYDSLGPGDYELQIKNEIGCTKRFPFTFIRRKSLAAQPTYLTNGCIGDSVFFYANTLENVETNWTGPNQFASSLVNPSIVSASPDVNGQYRLITSDAGCSETTYLNLDLKIPAQANFLLSNPCVDQAIELCLDNNFTNITWNTAATTTCIKLEQSGKYSFTAIDQQMCRITDSLEVKGCLDDDVYLPSAFTPNGDGINDYYKLFGEGMTQIEATIFNRWGQEIATLTSTNDNWDGTFQGNELPMGVYLLVLKYMDANGTSKQVLQRVSLMR